MTSIRGVHEGFTYYPEQVGEDLMLQASDAPGDYRIVAVTARGKADSVNVLIR
jgi:hypothetical protein